MLVNDASTMPGGRALLDMTQPQLAKAASFGLSTIVDFEKGRREVSEQAVDRLRRTLEAAGVEFIEENGGGPGVRLKKKSAKKPKSSGNP